MIQTEKPGAKSTNPASGLVFAHYPYLTKDERDAMLDGAVRAFEVWRATPTSDRATAFKRLAAVLRTRSENLATTICSEMGKPIRQARNEVEKCAHQCEWYAEHGPALIADEATSIDDERAYVSYLPLGTVLAIMPWNFPLWQVMRAAVPILLGGNALLLKHAPNVMGSAEHLVDAFSEAGFPGGLLASFNIPQEDAAGAIADKRVAAVTLTASVGAGSAVAALAGKSLKKTVLELGGSDPFIVLADADLDRAIPAAVQGRFQNTGQICIAAKRIIVEAAKAEEFTRRFVSAVKELKVGDPMDETTYIGPMARTDLRDQLHDQVKRSIEAGAELLLGGKPIGDERAAYYLPTVLSGVKPGMAAFDEETFGPVAAIIEARDAEDALALANNSEFGLSGAVWSEDLDLARSLARRMETGGVFINGFAASDPRGPIGGVKKSGYGRELSHFGIREFTNAQLVWEGRRV